jgi:hypothetical protein
MIESTIVTVACPRCGTPINLAHHPEKASALVGLCSCNPAGPVIEMPAPTTQTEEDNDDSSKR